LKSLQRERHLLRVAAVCAAVLIACSSDPTRDAAPDSGALASDAATPPAPPADAGADAPSPPLASALAAITATCKVASTARYSLSSGDPPTVDICSLVGAYFWTADMDVDCDGQTSAQCSAATDPSYQAQTSFTQSDGKPLDAAKLPYVVIPLPSARFSYVKADIRPGAVVAVVYKGQLAFGVFGDEGPASIIGEASYALVKSLGVDPDPKTGGLSGVREVTYIAFTGASAVVAPIEDHARAVTLGTDLATTLVQNN
jgi:hypothetical protein